tara:strand:+ start:148 stop:2763 length:2616 start_codon:yes stop_codon:yes gene_type:complete
MAKGRQRKRDNLLAKKAAEAGLAGLTPQALTSIISDDDNDLDNVSFSTTDGATTTIKNNRNKENQPRKRGFAPLGDTAPALPGSNLGGRKGYTPGNGNFPDTGPNGRGSFRPDDELMLANGSATRSNLGGRKGYMPGNNIPDAGPMGRGSFAPMEDELLLSNGPSVRGSRKPKQAKALTDFVGEDLTGADNQFVTVAMDSQDDLNYQADDSVIGEEINDDGTVTYEFAKDFNDMSVPEVTETEATAAQLEPGMYDNVEAGQERALTPTLDNKGMLEFPEEPIFGRQSDEEKATAAITMEEQLKEQALLRQLQADTVATDGRKGYTPGQDTLGVNDELDGARKGYMPGEDPLGTPGGNNRGSRKGYRPGNDNDGVDQDALYESPGYGQTAEEKADIDIQASMDGFDETTPSTTTTPNIHNNEPGTTSPEVIAKEAENADNEIAAATAGNPHLDGIVGDAKAKAEELKKGLEDGTTTVDEAKATIKNSLGQLGELLGIDGKDLIRGLFRYAGARVFGMSGNEAGRFAYEGFTMDETAEAKVEAAKLENMGLGTGATAQQKNLKAYKDEIQRIDNNTSLSDEEKVAAKKTANEVFGVNKPTSMGRPVNIKGINPDGSEEIVVGRRNDNNSYDVFVNDEWVPIEMSGLTDVQVTSRGAEQAFEKGMADPRNDVSIDNATYVSSGGVPTFKHKNESEKKSYQLAKRAVDVYPVVDAMMKDPEMRKHITSAMGGLQTYAAGNANAKITAASINLAIGDSIPQKYRSATQAWLQALLRADTGAAYSETEIMDYIATNIPQVGDTDDTVEFKLAQMQSTTETMAANAGQGAKYLLGRLDGSIEPPESVKRLQSVGLGTKTNSNDSTERSVELQSALDQY